MNILKSFTLLALITIFGFDSLSAAALEKCSALEEMKVDGQVIYTAMKILPSGEKAYFSCEPIYNKERQEIWSQYARDTDTFCNSNRGVFPGSMVFSKRGRLSDVLGEFLPEGAKHRGEFQSLVDGVEFDKKDTMKDSLRGIASGAIGMHCSVDTFISYVSDEPITGFLSPLSPADTKGDLDAYIESYSHLRMSISSFNSGDSRVYEHRGIFRNPMSMLRKDYRGMPLKFPAFTASARLKVSSDYKYMRVNTDGNSYMEALLLKSFGATELYPNYLDCGLEQFSEKFSVEAREKFLSESLCPLPKGHTYIKISALSDKFKA
jgi:hypothetical protein